MAAAELGFPQNVCVEADVSSGIKICCLNLQGVWWLVILCPAKTAALRAWQKLAGRWRLAGPDGLPRTQPVSVAQGKKKFS